MCIQDKNVYIIRTNKLMFVEKLLDFHNINVKNVSDKSYSEERFSTNNILVTWALQMFMLFIIHLEDFYSFFFFFFVACKNAW